MDALAVGPSATRPSAIEAGTAERPSAIGPSAIEAGTAELVVEVER